MVCLIRKEKIKLEFVVLSRKR